MNSPKGTLPGLKRLFSVALIIQATGGGFLLPPSVWSNPDVEQNFAQTNRNGKLLRSEKWQPFDARAARADFFVSPKGNDHWSGTLAAPNATSTDGPFATINRAKRAVRELKAKDYQPKEKAIDARYVGTA